MQIEILTAQPIAEVSVPPVQPQTFTLDAELRRVVKVLDNNGRARLMLNNAGSFPLLKGTMDTYEIYETVIARMAEPAEGRSLIPATDDDRAAAQAAYLSDGGR